MCIVFEKDSTNFIDMGNTCINVTIVRGEICISSIDFSLIFHARQLKVKIIIYFDRIKLK